jgi:hypothetical protein
MNHVRHGDLFLKQVKKSSLPGRWKEVKNFTLAEGEVTGHKHVISHFVDGLPLSKESKIFIKQLGQQTEVKVENKSARLTHKEHKEVKVKPGVYTLIHEEEYDPFLENVQRILD